MVQSAVDNNPEFKSIYVKTLEAAEQRCDVQMLIRLRGVANGDLVAIEARYHRKKNCFSSYVNLRNFVALVKTSIEKKFI